jgi:hypothetical protein
MNFFVRAVWGVTGTPIHTHDPPFIVHVRRVCMGRGGGVGGQ